MNVPLLPSLMILLLIAKPGTATPAPSLPGWLNSTLPTKGTGIQDEIKCYGLPYGGIGFTSHILTYYTLFMLSSDRSPWTWKRNKHWKFDLTLALIALAGTTITSIFTIVRCRNRWQFVCIALWKMSMSITLSAISTTAALRIRRSHDKQKTVSRQGGLYWLLLYIPGLGIGFAGLLSIVLQSWGNGWVQIVTIHFLSMCSAFVTLIVLIVSGLFLDRLRREREGYAPAPTSIYASTRAPPEQLFGSIGADRLASTYSQSSSAVVTPDQLFGSISSKPLLSHSRSGSEAQESYTDLSNKDSSRMDIPLIKITRDSIDISHSIPEATAESDNLLKSSNPSSEDDEKLKPRFKMDPRSPFAKNLEKFGDMINKIELPALSSLQAAIFGEGSGLDILMYIAGILVMPFLITIGIFGAFYSDFSLGSIAGNMIGVPSSDNSALYWGYFVFKRLPMLSI